MAKQGPVEDSVVQSERLLLRPSPLTISVEIPQEELAKIESDGNPLRSFLPKMRQLAASGLDTTDVELFSYGMFHEWIDDPAGWKTYKDLAAKLPRRWDLYQDYLGNDDKTLRLNRQPTRDISERLGIAGALTLSAKILGLTNADFKHLPSGPGSKTLDYAYPLHATDGREVFQVEAKGAHDGKAISVHAARIKEKKVQQRSRDPRTVLLGVIHDIQFTRSKKPSRLIVLDPPGEPHGFDPLYLNTLYRLRYYLAELSRITRGRLTVALSNRIALLDSRPAFWTALDRVPLVDQEGEPLKLPNTIADTVTLGNWRDVAHGRLFDLRINEALRTLEQVRKQSQVLYFRGLHRDVVEVLRDQDFAAVRNLRFPYELQRVRERNRNGYLVQLESGLVVGLIQDAQWDKTRLLRVWKQVTGEAVEEEGAE